ncbi:esterase, partial [Pseudomonas sp. MPR-R5A]
GLADEDRIGVAGTSMGGIVTLGALTQYKWIKSAVSLMGMPYYEKFALAQIDMLKKDGVEIPLNEEELEHLMEKIRQLDISMQ